MSSNHDHERPGSVGEDAAVTRAWRQASDAQPPARLDAGILAAAHRAVQENEAGAKTVPVPPRARHRWMKWQPLAAAATVAGLAFVLVQTLPRDREVAPPIRIEAQAPASAPAPDTALETRSSAPARAVTETPEMPAAGQTVRERRAESAARSPGAEAAADVADWAVRIEALHASGDLAGAAAALRAFRATDPDADAHLPESLREWARTVE